MQFRQQFEAHHKKLFMESNYQYAITAIWEGLFMKSHKNLTNRYKIKRFIQTNILQKKLMSKNFFAVKKLRKLIKNS